MAATPASVRRSLTLWQIATDFLSMSKSIRISDELSLRAAAAGAVAHRSPPQQIEHWAQIGRVLETALSYTGMTAIKSVGRADLDEALDQAGTVESVPRVHDLIGRTAATIETAE